MVSSLLPTVKNPKANFVERVHQTLGNMLRTTELDQHTLDPNGPFTGILANCAWAIRSSVDAITKRKAAQLVFDETCFLISHS